MRNDQIFVLMLVILLPMSGCFDDAVGDAEGAEDTTDGTTTIINNYYNNTTITENIVAENQSKTWYSSGGVFNSQWNMNGVDANGYFCLEMSALSGSYCQDAVRIGTTGGSTPVSTWNTSECTDQGGYTVQNQISIHNAPTCIIDFATINTSAGEVLMVYEIRGIELNSNCGGVSQNANIQSSVEYNIVSGSALTCTHTLSRTLSYDSQLVDNGLPSESHTQDPRPEFWSIVYAIQDATVI